MSKLELIELIIIAVIVVGLSIYYLIKAIKNKWIGQLIDTVKKAIKEAETAHPEGHGEDKKKYVMSMVQAKCEELGIPYTLLKKLVDKLVDTIVKNYNVIAKK